MAVAHETPSTTHVEVDGGGAERTVALPSVPPDHEEDDDWSGEVDLCESGGHQLTVPVALRRQQNPLKKLMATSAGSSDMPPTGQMAT